MVAKVIDTQHGHRLELVGNRLDVSAAICDFISDKAPITLTKLSINSMPGDNRRFILALAHDLYYGGYYEACTWFNEYPHNLIQTA